MATPFLDLHLHFEATGAPGKPDNRTDNFRMYVNVAKDGLVAI